MRRTVLMMAAVGLALLMIGPPGWVQAAAAPPATTRRAATGPTSAPIDPSTPKGALKTLAKALEAGDRKMLLDLLHADSPNEQKIADATAALAEATAELRRASTKAFGEQASRPLGVDSAAVTEALARVDSSTEKVEGDRATVTSPQDQGDSLILVQREKKWRVPMSQISGAVNAADLDRNLRDSSEQARLLKELAAEVSAGKFKTAMEARQELDKRIIHSAMPQAAAATAPAAAK
ncbi:MAG: hypothetical protein QOF78_4221 [Phycisphaerales bacterium]|nr:hypothetical protein [Phycisphaerales bacterium]